MSKLPDASAALSSVDVPTGQARISGDAELRTSHSAVPSMSPVDRRLTDALDRISAGDGESLLVLLEFLEPQIYKMYRRYRLSDSHVELHDFTHDILLDVVDAWHRKRAPVDRPSHWVRRVAHHTAVDKLRAEVRRRSEVAVLESEEEVPERALSTFDLVGKTGDRGLLQSLFLDRDMDERCVAYLTRIRGLTATNAAKRIIQVREVESSVTRSKLCELSVSTSSSSPHQTALYLGIPDPRALLLTVEEKGWEEWLAMWRIESHASPEDFSKQRTKIINIGRDFRFRLHGALAELIPHSPVELRACWRSMWTNKATAPLSFRAAAERLGIHEHQSRDYWSQVCMHLPIKVPWI